MNGTSVLGAGFAATGGVLVWSGLTGRKVTLVLRSFLSGKDPAKVKQESLNLGAAAGQLAAGALATGGFAGGSPSANKALGKQLAALYGWGSGAQWDALDNLWTRESHWDNKAVNSGSGATGIPQALPASKMPKAAQAPTYDPTAQIQWGLSYIKSTYGDPVHAWAHSQATGWY